VGQRMSCRHHIAAEEKRRGAALSEGIPVNRGTGRLHFFFHSPDSCLPVRDVLATGQPYFKTEPYIEVGAENYCYNCWQPNVAGFHNRGEQYLFLFTTCRHGSPRHFGKVFVVGYIERAKFGRNRDSGWSVIGPTKLCAFEDAFPLARMRDNTEQPRRLRRMLTPTEVSRLLGHFRMKRNILKRCRDEVRRLKKELGKLEPRERQRQDRRAKACKLCS
jgi:hypothetical protein